MLQILENIYFSIKKAIGGGLDTSDATATAGDILKDKTAYVNGEKVIGTLELGNASINTTGITTISNIYKYITKIDMFDTSSATVFDSLFQGFTNLKSIALFDTSNATNFSYVFAGCSSLEEIPKFDTSKVLYMGNAFRGCTNLKTVPVLDTSSLNHMNSAFDQCPNLSDESLNNIMQMCINAKKYTLTKTLTAIGINTQVQIDRCKNLSNYQAFLDAGWT